MEIDKIAFEKLRTLGITSSFDDLDINNDDKITKDDLSLTQDGKISSQIMQMLDLADDDAELVFNDASAKKSGATKNQYGINNTDAANYEKDIANSKGTVYLVLGNLPSCHGCLKLEEALQKRLGEFAGKAEIFNMQWKSPNSEKCYDIYKQVVSDVGSNIGFPCVIKLVDGKPVERISEGYAGNADAIVDKMLAKAESTSNTTNKTTNANNSASTQTQSATKTGVTVNEYGFYQTDSRTFEQDITKTKGTVYLVMGNLPGCGHCARLEKLLQERKDEVEANANIFNIQWRTSVYDNNSLCWNILEQIDAKRKFSGGFPVVVKFVDGQPVEMISQGNKSDYNVVIDEMIKKTEGTKGTINAGSTSTSATTSAAAATTSTKNQADITKAVNDLLAKYPIEGTSGSGYSLKNPEVVALKKAVEGGIISQLVQEGFSQSDIINIIAQAYPKAGIKNNDKGGFTVPRGSGADAKEFYNMFIEEMNKATSAEVLALQAEVKALNDQILTNNARLDILKASIEALKKEIETLIEKAIEESEEIEAEQKAEAKKIVAEELDRYSSAEGEITYEEFESSLSDRLNSLAGESNSKLSNLVSKMMRAESKMSVLNGYLTTFSSLVDANKALSEKVVSKTDEVAKVQEECKKSCENVQRCDPIGFSANGVKYDFFVDKDGNGEITNETEFLGATNGWDEMVALDKDGNGNVSVSEMSNIKVVVTAQDGSQSVKSVAELFSQTDSVDLNSYKAMNKDFANGNTLLGTFSLTFSGEKVDDAYNTMDKLSWLDENYNFSDEENGTGRFAQGNTKYEGVTDYAEELEVFKLDYEKMEVKLGSAWSKLGITRADLISQLGNATEKEAEAKASSIKDKIEQKVEEEEKKKKAEEDDCPECSVTLEE